MDWLYGFAALLLVIVTAPLWPMMLRAMRKHRGGGASAALGEMNAVFDPSQRHVAKVAQERVIERKDGEPPLP